MRAIDRDLLGHVIGRSAHETGRTHEDERLARQVDVLLVLGDVAGNRLVTQLAQLDSNLSRSDRVVAIAHHGPVALGWRVTPSDVADVGSPTDHVAHRVGQRAQGREQFVATTIGPESHLRGDGTRQQHARRHLCVEGFGRGHAHLHIATIGREQHTVGLVAQIAATAIDDADDERAARSSQIDRSIGVGRGSALTHRDHERVGHVETQSETRQLGRRDRIDVETTLAQFVEKIGATLPGHRGRALADHSDLGDGTTREARHHRGRKSARARSSHQSAVHFGDLAAQRLAQTLGCFADLLQQEVRSVAPIDVASRDFGTREFALANRHVGPVVRQPLDAFDRSGSLAVENDDLALHIGCR